MIGIFYFALVLAPYAFFLGLVKIVLRPRFYSPAYLGILVAGVVASIFTVGVVSSSVSASGTISDFSSWMPLLRVSFYAGCVLFITVVGLWLRFHPYETLREALVDIRDHSFPWCTSWRRLVLFCGGLVLFVSILSLLGLFGEV